MGIIGIDTLRVAFPIERYRTTPAIENVDHQRGTVWSKWHLEAGGSFGVGNGRAWVEASLPGRMVGNNTAALPFSDLYAAIDDLLTEVATIVDFDPAVVAPRRLRVPRVDIVRDFDGIETPALLIAGLGQSRQPGRSQVLRQSDHGRAESLTVTMKTSWTATAYDKHRESRGLAPAGRVRFEARLKTRRLQGVWATRHGGPVQVVADMTEEKMEKMARSTFDAVGFGATVMSREEVARRVATSGLSGQEQVALVGHLVYQAAGLGSPLSEGSERKYEKIARELGVRLHPDALQAGMRLDWDTGRAVLDVA